MNNKNKSRFKIAAILLIAILLRLPAFLYDYVNIDETDYTLAAQTILNGGIPYRDFLIYQPPLIYYIYALGFYLTGGINLWAVHIITIIIVVLTTLTIYKLTKLITNHQNSALLAALFYAVYSAAFIPQDMLAVNCEIVMMLPLTLSALVFFHAVDKQKSILFFLSGVFISIGVMTKYQGGIVLVGSLLYLFFIAHKYERTLTIKRKLRASFTLFIGFLLPILLYAAYLHANNSLLHAVEAFKYILLYAKGPAQSDTLYVALKFVSRSLIFSITSLPVWFGAAYIIIKTVKPNNHFGLPRFALYIIIWFLLSIIPIIMGGRIYFHYYILILPPAVILAGIWWSLKHDRIKKWVKYLISAWIIICSLGWTAYAVYVPLNPPSKKETWIEVPEYLKKLSQEDDSLFVWGCCYQLYFFSGLDMGTRFTSADYLTGRSPMTAGLEYDPKKKEPSSLDKLIADFKDEYQERVYFDTSKNIFPKAWKYLKEDIKSDPPTFIVDTTKSNYRRYARYPIKNYPYLSKLIKEDYTFINEIDGYRIFIRNDQLSRIK